MATRCGRKTNNLDQVFETIYESDVETARKLLQSSPNIRNSSGRTLIDQALLHSDIEKLRQFISLGCDVNLLTDGQTPLFTAIKLCKFEVAHLLLEAHADVNIKSTCVVTDEIEEGEESTEDSHYTLSPLYLAVRCNHMDMVEGLIKHGSQLDEASILHGAVRTGNPHMVETLLKAGAFVDQMDHKQWSPLATAIIKEEPIMIRLLLEHGADAHKVIPFLVFQNANKIFFSPLLLSTIFDTKMIPLLMSMGADPCAGCVPHGTAHTMDLKWCMAPLCNSLGRDSKSLKYFLTANCPMYWTPGDHAPVKDADPHDSFHQHDSALYMALRRGRSSVELLLNCGFNISDCGSPTRRMARKVINDNKYKVIVKLLKYSLERPQTLQSLCRNVIRHHIGREISEKVKHLRLPLSLVNYVLLRDVFVL